MESFKLVSEAAEIAASRYPDMDTKDMDEAISGLIASFKCEPASRFAGELAVHVSRVEPFETDFISRVFRGVEKFENVVAFLRKAQFQAIVKKVNADRAGSLLSLYQMEHCSYVAGVEK